MDIFEKSVIKICVAYIDIFSNINMLLKKKKSPLLDSLNLKGFSVYFCVFWPVSHAVLLT